MKAVIIVVVVVAVLVLLALSLAVRIMKQYEEGVLFRLGRLRGSRAPGLRLIIPVRRQPAPGLAADRDDADPVAGHHHS
jgi:regulator of protease activity HflC (stomatin/prohibitin superfamily)